ncbi:MAG: hypothetical protein GX638_10200 [Crenarchaeota archaeon]|nr:hypothetical protein [Thermoproteota archaeon]
MKSRKLTDIETLYKILLEEKTEFIHDEFGKLLSIMCVFSDVYITRFKEHLINLSFVIENIRLPVEETIDILQKNPFVLGLKL